MTESINYVIDENASIKEALKVIENNHKGIICLSGKKSNSKNCIVAVATDGDIRRAFLKGVSIDDPISKCANYNFQYASNDLSRENIIKKLDGPIRCLPVLDKNLKFQSMISKDDFPLKNEGPIYVRSRAPVRVAFGGGGSDVTHYFEKNMGAVINATISIYSHATMKVNNNNEIKISSLDLDYELNAKNLDDAITKKGPLGLIQSILKIIKPDFGFDLFLNSDYSVGSGLGGSATVSAAVIGCFNELRNDKWNRHEIAEIAFQAERHYLGIAGGWQDQYAAVFGGFNFLEFKADQNIVHPIRVQDDIILELEDSLILCDTGILHNSGNIHNDQKKTTSSKEMKEQIKKSVDLTYDIRNYLLRGSLSNFGETLHQAWSLKKKFSKLISNKEIDEIYEFAIKNGATGGKLLGAGGGGFFIFYVPPFKKNILIKSLQERGHVLKPFTFEVNGMQAWRTRQ